MSAKATPGQFRKRALEAQKRLAASGSHFEGDTPAKRLRRMAEAVVLPEAFNRYYLPHYFRCEPAEFHLELYRALEFFQRTVVRAPRGHAKSTVVTFAYTLHQVACARVLKMWVDGTLEKENPELFGEILEVMAEELVRRVAAALAQLDANSAESLAVLNEALATRATGRIPLHWDPYIQIVSVTEATAAEFTGAIQLELETNDLLRSDWGRLIAPRQAEADWVSLTDVRVRAFGMMSAVRGGKHRQYRPSLAILDDPDSEETVGTTRLRDKQQQKVVAGLAFGLEPMVGRLFMVGTPLHPDCLVCRFTKPDFDSRWLKLRFAAIQEDGTPLWPERWTIEALQEEEDAAPEAFAMEMMDTPPSAGKPFETIHYYDREEWKDVDLPKILAFDPALGRTEKADYQAIVVLRGPTPAGELLVHRCELLRIGDPKVLMERVNQIRKEEQPDMAIMETIGFQAVLVTLSSMLAEGGSALLADWLRIDSQVQGKDLRIRGMAPASNSGKIRFPADKSCRNLECQALDYPDGKKDGLDVMEMAYRQTRQRLHRSEIRHNPRRFAGDDLDRGWQSGSGRSRLRRNRGAV